MNDLEYTYVREVDDLRWWFNEKKSSNENVIDALQVLIEDDECTQEYLQFQAEVALLALINDPDVQAAFVKFKKILGTVKGSCE